MKGVIVMFLTTIALFTVFFTLDVYNRNYIAVLLAFDMCFMFVYLVAKIKTLEYMTKSYNLEHKKRIDLEQELLKELDLSNAIITRSKSAPLGHAFGKRVTKRISDGT